MSESVRLLKGIMKTSGWTQEQVAMKLGVSFPTMNAWVNGKSKPRAAMMDRIRRLYLAQDVTKDIEPTYVTILNVEDLRIDEIVLLRKEQGLVRVYKTEDGRRCLTEMSVADSNDKVIDGTSSAGRIYDRFELAARARVLFIYHRIAIARVVEWDYVEKGE